MNSKRKFFILISLVVVSILIFSFSGYFGFNLSYIVNFFLFNRVLAAFVYTVLSSILLIFSFSSIALTGFGGLLFSWQEVLIYSMIGLMIASIVHFYTAKHLGKSYVQSYLKKKEKIERIDDIIEKNTFKTIVVLNSIFLVPPIVCNFIGGVINIDFKKFLVATFLGNICNTFFTVYLINGLLYSNTLQIYISIAGLIATTLVALLFYTGELKTILKLSLPSFLLKEN